MSLPTAMLPYSDSMYKERFSDKMKKRILAITLCVLLLASALSLSGCTGCFSDTTVSGTKYGLLMISDVPYTLEKDESGKDSPVIDTTAFAGAVWKGIKDASATEGLMYKYFPPAKVEKSESVSYANAFKDAVKQQITLAISNADMSGKPVIIIPGEEYVAAYMESQASSKKAFETIYTFIVGASPLSKAANTAEINEKCYTLIIDYTEMAYLSGYTAVMSGYTKIGFLGYGDDLARAMLEGMILGAEKAAAEKGLADGSVEIKYADATDPDDTSKAKVLFDLCDAVMPQNAELEALLNKCAGEKAVIGVTGKLDGAVSFSYHVSPTKLSETVTKSLQNSVRGIACAVVNTVGIKDNMFNYTAKDGFAYTSTDAEALMNTVGADESVKASGDITTLALKYVKAEKK